LSNWSHLMLLQQSENFAGYLDPADALDHRQEDKHY
jgi:hypothetical protein